MRILSLLLVLLFAATALPTETLAQYRANDELHAGHQAYDDPSRTSPNRSAELEWGSGQITIEWGAPSVRDRQVYGRLIPEGQVWRTGANEATVIHFDDNVRIAGKALDAGSYALFSMGGPNRWTFIFNKVHQQWGAFTHDEGEDALRVNVEPETGDHQEELLFSFEGTTESSTTVRLRWGTASVAFDVECAID